MSTLKEAQVARDKIVSARRDTYPHVIGVGIEAIDGDDEYAVSVRVEGSAVHEVPSEVDGVPIRTHRRGRATAYVR